MFVRPTQQTEWREEKGKGNKGKENFKRERTKYVLKRKMGLN